MKDCKTELSPGEAPLALNHHYVIPIKRVCSYTPGIQEVFSTAPIGGLEWLRIIAFAVVIFLIVELEKWLKPGSYIIPHVRQLFARRA